MLRMLQAYATAYLNGESTDEDFLLLTAGVLARRWDELRGTDDITSDVVTLAETFAAIPVES